MRIYVDAAVHSWRGKLWCHMFSPDLATLHAFAAEIGMKREWFQDPRTMTKVSWPHYDITAQRRSLAIRLGAKPLGRHQTIVMSRVILNRFQGVEGTPKAVDPLAFHRRRNSPMTERVAAWLETEMTVLDVQRQQAA